MRNPTLQDVVLGQYKASIAKDGKSKVPGYLEDQDVPSESRTPTFVAAVLYIDNARWDGVPFLIKAGMGLIKNRSSLSYLSHFVDYTSPQLFCSFKFTFPS